ncbi:MAG: hypothetical protein COV76_04950 [Candidatus Omnitrophica bacterium CG11_big_fil_rev_8_21_14_0_20_64_10]|nr:MAG: hypothetical protein COV76_04950 [Candidatus Omnitrophica bacterium CG11_big_fil_rev_8_21_14_0_20_64_10]
MAVREEQDRRVGGGSEKLLTLEEAARRLSLPPDDVKALIGRGTLPAFRIGGQLLRVRSEDLDRFIRQERSRWLVRPAAQPAGGSESPGARTTFWGRIADFLYFNDFYLVAVLIILTLLALILTL